MGIFSQFFDFFRPKVCTFGPSGRGRVRGTVKRMSRKR